MVKVGIAGASGYAGAELIRIVEAHPQFKLFALSAGSFAGASLASVHPQFAAHHKLANLIFSETTSETFRDCDLVFFALPHGQSGELIKQLPEDTKVVDLGADFRLTDANLWSKYYDGPHAGTFVYGLPELPERRAQISTASRVANPGCYATAIQLSLAPLIAANLVDASDIVVVAASGTSGAGRRAAVNLLGSEVMGSISAYRIGGTHQHTPEIEQELQKYSSQSVALNFTPLLAPMPRGILATTSVKTTASKEQLYECLAKAYNDEPFVVVLPDGQLPTTAATLGSNSALMQVAVDEHTGRATIVTAIDNLIKGAAGQAIQNANLMFNISEISGLSVIGIAP